MTTFKIVPYIQCFFMAPFLYFLFPFYFLYFLYCLFLGYLLVFWQMPIHSPVPFSITGGIWFLCIWFSHSTNLRGPSKNSSPGLFLNDKGAKVEGKERNVELHRSGFQSGKGIIMGKEISLSDCQFHIYKNKINIIYSINCFERIHEMRCLR